MPHIEAAPLFFLAQWGCLRSAPADSHLLPRPHWTRAVLIPMIATVRHRPASLRVARSHLPRR